MADKIHPSEQPSLGPNIHRPLSTSKQRELEYSTQTLKKEPSNRPLLNTDPIDPSYADLTSVLKNTEAKTREIYGRPIVYQLPKQLSDMKDRVLTELNKTFPDADVKVSAEQVLIGSTPGNFISVRITEEGKSMTKTGIKDIENAVGQALKGVRHRIEPSIINEENKLIITVEDRIK